jgi:dimethylaniline monooxygenase (N-oxide forming)
MRPNGAEGPDGGLRKRIAVIGGGPAGLAVMKEMKAAGHQVTGFEKRASVGGVYQGSYDGMQLTSSTAITQFSDYVVRDLDFPVLWKAPEYVDYLEDYARRFDVLRHYRFETGVTSVLRLPGGGWRVTSQSPEGEDELDVDHVVVCTGGNMKPRYPEWLEGGCFKGEVWHSARVRTDADFAGRRVLVVGMGESGSDIALMAARGGVSCAISTRNGPGFVIPRTFRGLPTDLDTNRCYHALPRSVVNKPIVRFKVKIEDALVHPDEDAAVLARAGELNRARGLAPFYRFGTKSIAFIEAMLYHGAGYHGDVAELKEDRVVFRDGTEYECDTIVCCTGFGPEFSFLQEHEPALARRGMQSRAMYKRMIVPEEGTDIAFVGFVRPGIGSVPPCAEMQARYLAQLVSGEKPLPSRAEMEEDIELHASLDLKYFPADAARVSALTDFFRFMESMAHEIGCRPKLGRLFLRSPWTAVKVLTGPLCAAQFRLMGPGADPKPAREALRRIPTMPWPVLAYEAVLLFGCWALGLTREPWRKWKFRAAPAPRREPHGVERPQPALQ